MMSSTTVPYRHGQWCPVLDDLLERSYTPTSSMLTVNPLKAFPSNFKIKKKGSKSASSSQKATAGHSRLYHRLRDAISHHGGAAVVLLIVLENQWCLSGQNPRDWERDARRALKHNKDKWQNPQSVCGSALRNEIFCCRGLVFLFLLCFYSPGVVISQTQGESKSRLQTMHMHTHRRTHKTSRRTQGDCCEEAPGGEVTFDTDSNISYPWTHTHTDQASQPPSSPTPGGHRKRGRLGR